MGEVTHTHTSLSLLAVLNEECELAKIQQSAAGAHGSKANSLSPTHTHIYTLPAGHWSHPNSCMFQSIRHLSSFPKSAFQSGIEVKALQKEIPG